MKRGKILVALLVFSFLLAPGVTSGAVETAPKPSEKIEDLKSQIRRGTSLLFKLESSLEDQKQTLENTSDTVKTAKKALSETSKKIQSLKNQLLNVQEKISQSNNKILSVRKQIAERETAIELFYKDMQKIGKEEKRLSLIQASVLKAYDTQSSLSGTSLFLSSFNLGEVLRKKFFLQISAEESAKALNASSEEENLIARAQSELLEKREKLIELKKRLDGEKGNLLFYKESRQRLLALTKGDEEKYRALIEQSKREQEDINMVIGRLKENYAYVSEKLNLLKNNGEFGLSYGVADYEAALRESPFSVKTELRWPVSPVRGISAYFHDDAYRKAMGITHNAVDIRIPQGSTVRAGATGIVYKTVDAGTGYSYIIIAHENNLLTLYGHMYDIFVNEGDSVFSGQQIGLSGGIPGTKGAGWLTTGAHLHFEVFKDWKHVDPLEYLPLEYLPLEYIPEKYASKLTGAREKIPRSPAENTTR